MTLRNLLKNPAKDIYFCMYHERMHVYEFWEAKISVFWHINN